MAKNSELFDQHVPVRLLKALTKLVFENYRQSSKYCYRNFSDAQAKDLSGDHRRARIEEDLTGIPALFQGDVEVIPRTYEHNTGSYNELKSGLVVLTSSCISDPDIVPRFAKFRSTLAQNGQRELFELPSREGEPSRYLYSILTHGVDLNSEKRAWPAFIHIQFPNESCTAYIDDGINLFERFPELVAEYIPKPAMHVSPKVRRYKKANVA